MLLHLSTVSLMTSWLFQRHLRVLYIPRTCPERQHHRQYEVIDLANNSKTPRSHHAGVSTANTVSHLNVTETLVSALIHETNVNIFRLLSLIQVTRRLVLQRVHHRAPSNDSLLYEYNAYVVAPFTPDAYHHSSMPSAYPPNRSENLHPIQLYYLWTDAAFDDALSSTARAG